MGTYVKIFPIAVDYWFNLIAVPIAGIKTVIARCVAANADPGVLYPLLECDPKRRFDF